MCTNGPQPWWHCRRWFRTRPGQSSGWQDNLENEIILPEDFTCTDFSYYLADDWRLHKAENTLRLSRLLLKVVRQGFEAITVHLVPAYVQLPVTESKALAGC